MDHGRALGLLAGGGWHGWAALLDLSPKIPPLASLLNGSVMALAGETADQASWALALWHGLLLLVVAAWGRQLLCPGFALLAAALTALAPALAAVRVDYTLDLPLAATTTLALWLLGRWQAPPPRGGRWPQALLAGLAVAAALLVKQSALLVLTGPGLWAAGQALSRRGRRLQALAALALVLALLLPWLHHNWITTIGGTNRAVVESAAKEGDPAVFSLASLLWYPRLWPAQLGLPTLLIGLGGGLLAAWQRKPLRQLPPGWAWLIGSALAGWLLTCLSPNKDARYITPVLPLLLLLLARGWWQLGLLCQKRLGAGWSSTLLAAALAISTADSSTGRAKSLQHHANQGLIKAVALLRQQVGPQPATVLITASSPELNEHTLTFLGRQNGGQLLARRLGRSPGQEEIALEQARWWILATGDQGTTRRSGRALSEQVRSDGRFRRMQTWPWSEGRALELWQRKPEAGDPPGLDQRFIQLAAGIGQGPRGLAPALAAIGPWHLVDPTFSYQPRVQRWAQARLRENPADRDALWSLALLAVLQNRPAQADRWFRRLEQLEGRGSWPSAYRSVVLLADWNSCAAARVADTGSGGQSGDAAQVLTALRDLGRSGCFDPRGILDLRGSLPAAIQQVQAQLKPGGQATR